MQRGRKTTCRLDMLVAGERTPQKEAIEVEAGEGCVPSGENDKWETSGKKLVRADDSLGPADPDTRNTVEEFLGQQARVLA